MTIDLQSFILGMGLVLVIIGLMGGVIALVKVMRLEKNKNNVDIGFQQQIDNIYRHVDEQVNHISHEFSNLNKEIDSRFDKMYNKIMTETNPKKRILNMIKTGVYSSEPTDDKDKE